MNKNISKIPKQHLNEFLTQQTSLFRSRVQLSAVLFPLTFFVGSIVTTLIQGDFFA